jgi:pilus assembly protein CpaB
MNVRRTPLVVGITLSVGTGFLLLNFLAGTHKSGAAVAQRTVVIAVKEIPARAQIAAGMITTSTRSSDEVDSDVVANTQNVVGHVALITIPVGSAVTQSKIAMPSTLALPMRLRDGLRAVSIAIDRVKGVSGLIQPGDRVDVIAVPPRVGNESPKATTILRGALVLALGNEIETVSATPAPDSQQLTTVTLAVNPRQANLLAAGDVYTTLRLALRAPSESVTAYPTEPIAFGVAQVQAIAPIAAQTVVAPTVAAPQPVSSVTKLAGSYIPVIEGDQIAPPPESRR